MSDPSIPEGSTLRRRSSIKSIKTLGFTSAETEREVDAADVVGISILTRAAEDDDERSRDDRRDQRRCRGCFRRWRRNWIVLGCVLGVGLVVGVIYGIVVQVLWGRYDPARYGRTVGDTGGQIWAHSHNDELQDEPLTLALRLGFSSIEIDTFYIPPLPNSFTNKSYLSIGHDEQYLRNGTLVEVYLAPILQKLDTLNPNRTSNSTSWVGLHPTNTSTTTQLVFDFKNAPEDSYTALEGDLRRLREKGYMTTYDTLSKQWTRAPLLVLVTGDGPLGAVYHSSNRSIFYDAPLLSLSQQFSIPASRWGPAVSGLEWTAELAPMASAKIPTYAQFAPVLPPPPNSVVSRRLEGYGREAEKRGIRARWWGAVRGPRWVRERGWSVLRESGPGWVGGDDLVELADWLGRYLI